MAMPEFALGMDRAIALLIAGYVLQVDDGFGLRLGIVEGGRFVLFAVNHQHGNGSTHRWHGGCFRASQGFVGGEFGAGWAF